MDKFGGMSKEEFKRKMKRVIRFEGGYGEGEVSKRIISALEDKGIDGGVEIKEAEDGMSMVCSIRGVDGKYTYSCSPDGQSPEEWVAELLR